MGEMGERPENDAEWRARGSAWEAWLGSPDVPPDVPPVPRPPEQGERLTSQYQPSPGARIDVPDGAIAGEDEIFGAHARLARPMVGLVSGLNTGWTPRSAHEAVSAMSNTATALHGEPNAAGMWQMFDDANRHVHTALNANVVPIEQEVASAAVIWWGQPQADGSSEVVMGAVGPMHAMLLEPGEPAADGKAALPPRVTSLWTAQSPREHALGRDSDPDPALQRLTLKPGEKVFFVNDALLERYTSSGTLTMDDLLAVAANAQTGADLAHKLVQRALDDAPNRAKASWPRSLTAAAYMVEEVGTPKEMEPDPQTPAPAAEPVPVREVVSAEAATGAEEQYVISDEEVLKLLTYADIIPGRDLDRIIPSPDMKIWMEGSRLLVAEVGLDRVKSFAADIREQVRDMLARLGSQPGLLGNSLSGPLRKLSERRVDQGPLVSLEAIEYLQDPDRSAGVPPEISALTALVVDRLVAERYVSQPAPGGITPSRQRAIDDILMAANGPAHVTDAEWSRIAMYLRQEIANQPPTRSHRHSGAPEDPNEPLDRLDANLEAERAKPADGKTPNAAATEDVLEPNTEAMKLARERQEQAQAWCNQLLAFSKELQRLRSKSGALGPGGEWARWSALLQEGQRRGFVDVRPGTNGQRDQLVPIDLDPQGVLGLKDVQAELSEAIGEYGPLILQAQQSAILSEVMQRLEGIREQYRDDPMALQRALLDEQVVVQRVVLAAVMPPALKGENTPPNVRLYGPLNARARRLSARLGELIGEAKVAEQEQRAAAKVRAGTMLAAAKERAEVVLERQRQEIEREQQAEQARLEQLEKDRQDKEAQEVAEKVAKAKAEQGDIDRQEQERLEADAKAVKDAEELKQKAQKEAAEEAEQEEARLAAEAAKDRHEKFVSEGRLTILDSREAAAPATVDPDAEPVAAGTGAEPSGDDAEAVAEPEPDAAAAEAERAEKRYRGILNRIESASSMDRLSGAVKAALNANLLASADDLAAVRRRPMYERITALAGSAESQRLVEAITYRYETLKAYRDIEPVVQGQVVDPDGPDVAGWEQLKARYEGPELGSNWASPTDVEISALLAASPDRPTLTALARLLTANRRLRNIYSGTGRFDLSFAGARARLEVADASDAVAQQVIEALRKSPRSPRTSGS